MHHQIHLQAIAAGAALALLMQPLSATNSFPSSGNVGIGTGTPSAKLEVLGGVVISPSTSDSSLKIGKVEVQSYSTNNEWLGFNVYFDGTSFRYRSSGYAQMIYSTVPGRLDFRTVGTGTAGATASMGDAVRLSILPDGNVGIGTITPSHKLAVNGTIRAKEVIVDTGWADYVFAPGYRLAPLSEVEAHIKEHKRLPGIPSEATVAQEGVSLGEVQTMLLAKIEELTLHQIAQEKRILRLEAENNHLRNISTPHATQ